MYSHALHVINRLPILLLVALSLYWLTSCEHQAPLPKPVGSLPLSPPGEARFELVASYTKGDGNIEEVKKQIQEGDVLAFWMTKKETSQGILRVRIGALAFAVLDFGHLAIAVKYPERDPPIRLFSSLPGVGSHSSGDLEGLEKKNFMVYRLDRWSEMNTARLREFVSIARKKSRKVCGYDYFEAVGLWSHGLEPRTPEQVHGGYMCSTAVAAALHYAGLDLDNIDSHEMFKIVGPKMVFTSKGRLIGPPEISKSDK